MYKLIRSFKSDKCKLINISRHSNKITETIKTALAKNKICAALTLEFESRTMQKKNRKKEKKTLNGQTN